MRLRIAPPQGGVFVCPNMNERATEMSKPKKGRPSEYEKAGGDVKAPELVRQLALLGATEEEIAAAFGVSRRTITNWEQQHDAFRAALLEGRIAADALVGQRLFERALGYSHPEDKIFYDSKTGETVVHETTKHYPPDTTAAIFWLKNRRPNEWRDKKEVTGNLSIIASEPLTEDEWENEHADD